MRVEHVGGALILRPGPGDWCNQRVWNFLEDFDLPPAQWHAEVDDAIRTQESPLSRVVIDATEMLCVTMRDHGFLYELSKRLRAAGIKVTVIARPNEVRAFTFLRCLREYYDLVGTLDEALSE